MTHPGAQVRPLTVPLAEASDVNMVGTKAARLGELLRAGFPVPDGVVLTTAAAGDPAWPEALRAAIGTLGTAGLAVRSSAVAEDLDHASFAGLYETVLDVLPDGLEAAVRACWASASSPSVVAYTDVRAPDSRPGIAVLVQRLVKPDASGVALSADPLTGRRDEVIVTAVPGRGGALVGGQAVGEQWRVGPGPAVRHRSTERAISAAEARAVAEVVRRIEDLAGAPQDVEWAIADGHVRVLQARAMSALPPPVDWSAPLPGGWMRNFRLGEWLPEPVTPLFETWFLPLVEARFAAEQARDAGFMVPAPLHVVVNGWYFHSPFGAAGPGIMFAGFLRRPRFGVGSVAMRALPQLSDRLIALPLTERWRQDVLPSYRALVDGGLLRVETCPPAELMALVDDIADAVGRYLWSIVMVAGFAWKSEAVLARLCRRHLGAVLPAGHQALLCGITTAPLVNPAHAVHSLDWVHPTLGESRRHPDGVEGQPDGVEGQPDGVEGQPDGVEGQPDGVEGQPDGVEGQPDEVEAGDDDRRRRAVDARTELQAACRATLSGRRQKQFDIVLELTQRYGRLREEQVASFTLAWPLLRRAVLLLGADAAARSVIASPADVFFLTQAELGGEQPRRPDVQQRRLLWDRQRCLAPPLIVGTPTAFIRRFMIDEVESMRPAAVATAPASTPGAIVGQPASPGRAVGPVRVLRSPADHSRVSPGDVLVVSTMTPGLTPLFRQVAAIVSDGGSLAAHASLIAREYGIPAVVATGDATHRLHDGEIVAVDGARGTVEPVGDIEP